MKMETGRSQKLLKVCAVACAGIGMLSLVLAASCAGGRFPRHEYDDAYALLIAGDYEDAAEAFRRLSLSSPSYPEIWYNYGVCLMETARYPEAAESLQKAADLHGNAVMYDDTPGLRGDAMTAIGEVHLLQRDFEKAEEQFDKCLAERSDRAAINAIAATYIRLGFIDRAEAYFSQRNIDVWM